MYVFVHCCVHRIIHLSLSFILSHTHENFILLLFCCLKKKNIENTQTGLTSMLEYTYLSFSDVLGKYLAATSLRAERMPLPYSGMCSASAL